MVFVDKGLTRPNDCKGSVCIIETVGATFLIIIEDINIYLAMLSNFTVGKAGSMFIGMIYYQNGLGCSF